MSRLLFLHLKNFVSVIEQGNSFFRKRCVGVQRRKNQLDNLCNNRRVSTTPTSFPFRNGVQMKLSHRGLWRQTRTVVSVTTCFFMGLYSVPLFYLLFTIPTKLTRAPPYLAGVFAVFISATVELLSNRNWTGTNNCI